jgi:hypothetical protein
MTALEALTCDDPRPLLRWLGDRAGGRKVRLFGCHCCRRVWGQLDDRHRRAVWSSECYADGRISPLAWCRLGAGLPPARTHAEEAAWAAWRGYGIVAAWRAAEAAEAVTAPARRLATWQDERAWQAALLRELCGDPTRDRPVARAVLCWHDGTVRRLAEGIAEGRTFHLMPILADALLDAGCDDDELMAHCRDEGPHVRGCWALDRVLGRE